MNEISRNKSKWIAKLIGFFSLVIIFSTYTGISSATIEAPDIEQGDFVSSAYNDTISGHQMNFDYLRIIEYLDSHDSSFERDFMRKEISNHLKYYQTFNRHSASLQDKMLRKNVSRSNVSLSLDTYYVPDDYTTIQEAVNYVSDGDTIIVRNGVYIENINVNKPLTIRSENGPKMTIIKAMLETDHIFEVTADYVNISGFTIKEARGDWWDFDIAGICLKYVEHCNITNNIASNNGDGIYLCYSSNNSITNNIASTNIWEGIYLYYSVNNSITNNIALDNYRGISLNSGNNNTITNNNPSNNSYGISSYYSSDNSITNNHFKNGGIHIFGYELSSYNTHVIEGNTLNEKPIYYYKNVNGIKVTEDAGQVILANCTAATIENMNISVADSVQLAYTTNSEISNNNLSDSYGVTLYYSNNNIIYNNKASSITLYTSSNNNTINSNNLNSNSNLRINLWSSSNKNNVTNNNLSNNGWYGIDIYDSNNNNIYLNNFINNQYAVRVYYASSNNIYLNNFINNEYSVYNPYSHSTNIWNSTSKVTYTYNVTPYENYLGNYWDDFTGSDSDGDGIGDDPYSIDSDKDYYPLMEPFEKYSRPPKQPSVEISTDKSEYAPGDTMTVTLNIENPTVSPAIFQCYIGVVGYKEVPWSKSTNISYIIPAGYAGIHAIPIQIGDLGDSSASIIHFVHLYDSTTDKVLDQDTALATFNHGSGNIVTIPQVDIVKEIEKTIKRAEPQI